MKKQSNRRLRFEGLERREVMSATLFESEPNNTKLSADLVQLDSVDNAAVVRGLIANRNDEDFFRYRPTVSGPLSLSLTDDASLAAKISVEDVRGQKLFESEPNNGVGGGVFQVTAGVDVIFRVRGQKKTTGDYAIQLNLGATPASSTPVSESGLPPTSSSIASTVQLEVEKNDTKATANKVDFSGMLQIQGAANGKRDNDFFALKPTASGTVKLNLNAPDGLVKLSIEDSLGRKLFESEPKDGINSGEFAVTGGKTYYIRVRAVGSSVSPYFINLE